MATSLKLPEEVKEELNNYRYEKEAYHVVIKRIIEENKELKEDKKTLTEALASEKTDSEKKLYEDILKRLNILPNPFTVEGIDNLLSLNISNEVPNVLINIYPYLIQLALLSDNVIENYSSATAKLYVDKAEKFSNNLNSFVEEIKASEDSDIRIAIEHYVNYLGIRTDHIKLLMLNNLL